MLLRVNEAPPADAAAVTEVNFPTAMIRLPTWTMASTRPSLTFGVKFAENVYYGFWFAPEFKLMRKMIDETQATVSGDVRLKLFRGNAIVVGRRSPNSLYDEKVATFEADTVYNQRDAEGFIKLNALRLRLGGER